MIALLIKLGLFVEILIATLFSIWLLHSGTDISLFLHLRIFSLIFWIRFWALQVVGAARHPWIVDILFFGESNEFYNIKYLYFIYQNQMIVYLSDYNYCSLIYLCKLFFLLILLCILLLDLEFTSLSFCWYLDVLLKLAKNHTF